MRNVMRRNSRRVLFFLYQNWKDAESLCDLFGSHKQQAKDAVWWLGPFWQNVAETDFDAKIVDTN